MTQAANTPRFSTTSNYVLVRPWELEVETATPLTLEMHFRPRDCVVAIGVLPGVCSFAQAMLNVLGVRDATVYRCKNPQVAMCTYFAKKSEVKIAGDSEEREICLYGRAVGRAMQLLLARVWPPSDRANAASLLTHPISGDQADLAIDAALAQAVASYMETSTRDASQSIEDSTDLPDKAHETAHNIHVHSSKATSPSRTPGKSAWRYSASWEFQRLVATPIDFLRNASASEQSVPSSSIRSPTTARGVYCTGSASTISTPYVQGKGGRADIEQTGNLVQILGLFKEMSMSPDDCAELQRFILDINGVRCKPALPVTFTPTPAWRRPNKITPDHDADDLWYPISATVNDALTRAGVTVFTAKYTIVFIGNAPGVYVSVESAKHRNRGTPPTCLRFEFAPTPFQAVDRWRLRLRHGAVEIVKLKKIKSQEQI